MKKVVTILQSNYFPWRGYFDLINNSDIFVFYDQAKYTKNDWRNRNRIASSGNMHWITIPISKVYEKLSIDKVTLDCSPNWRSSHLSLIDFCYRHDPMYKSQLRPLLEHCLFEYKTNFLSELNQYIIKLICKEANISTVFIDSSSIVSKTTRIETLINIVQSVGGQIYLSGSSATNYIDPYLNNFHEQGIEVRFYKYGDYPNYSSANKYYDNFLSIIDYLAHEKIENLQTYLAIKT